MTQHMTIKEFDLTCRNREENGFVNFKGKQMSQMFLDRIVMEKMDMSHATLTESDFTEASLVSVKFVEADCNKVCFESARLVNADFQGATCTEALFVDAYIEGADFRGANCTRASFLGADLSGADFSGADLSGADFTDADLSEAKFTGAKFDGTVFDHAKFSQTSIDWHALRGMDLSTIQESESLTANRLELKEKIEMVRYFEKDDLVFAGKWSGTLDDFKVWGENMPNHKHQMQILAMHQYFETRRNL